MHEIKFRNVFKLAYLAVAIHFALSIILSVIFEEKYDVQTGEVYETVMSYSNFKKIFNSYNLTHTPDILKQELQLSLVEDVDTQQVNIVSSDMKFIMTFILYKNTSPLKLRYIFGSELINPKKGTIGKGFDVNGTRTSIKCNSILQNHFESTFDHDMAIRLYHNRIRGIICHYHNFFGLLIIPEFSLLFLLTIIAFIKYIHNKI